MANKTEKSNKNKIAVILAVFCIIAIVGVMAFKEISGLKTTGLSRLYDYPSAGLGQIPEHLLHYQEIDSIETGFSNVYAFDIDKNGSFYIAGDQELRIFDKDGVQTNQVTLSHQPTAICVADDGYIYIALGNHIVKYNPEFRLVATWQPSSENAMLTSIDVYRDNVFIADAAGRIVRRFDTEGNFINSIGARDPDRNVPGISLPSPNFTVTVAYDGLLRLNNTGRHRIEAYTFDGFLEIFWGNPSAAIEGFCGCCNPISFDMLPGGGYVTAEKGLVRVKTYDADGIFQSVVAGAEQLMDSQQSELSSVAFSVRADETGTIYILDPIERSVRFFQRKEND